MRKIVVAITLAAVLIAVVVSVGFARDVLGRDRTVISFALRKLKFKQSYIDGRIKFTVTKETIDFLKEHEGDEITIANDSLIYFPGEKLLKEKNLPEHDPRDDEEYNPGKYEVKQ
jgi:hypothetical protein